MLYRLIYVSRPSDAFVHRDIREILTVSQRNNAQRGVSGILVFNSGFFLQWLEGARSAVNERFAHILKDERHGEAEILAYEPVSERLFADWNMGYLGEGVLNRDLLYRFTVGTHFNPYQLSAESVSTFLQVASRDSVTLMP